MSLFLMLSLRENEAVAASEYRDFVQATGLSPELLEHRIFDSAGFRVGDVSRYDGIFVGGSSLNMSTPQYGAWQVAVVRELSSLLDSPTPVFFTCFGTGLIAQVLGGRIGHEYAEQTSASRVELTAAGRTDPVFGSLPTTFEALTGHTECVIDPSPRATVVASGPTCLVQALRVGPHTWATQFHPEMDVEGMARRMNFYRHHGYFPDEEFEAIVDSLRGVDTSHAHRILRNFVGYCRARAATEPEEAADYTVEACMRS
ncbi:glutamine amidotransferase [Corynebacterium sp. zg-331]|uniref:glutamine amidotransferase n=1 Tax=unclassified Corynebacterium TaxID=2624378 RepID=UPI00128E8812|nr:MULTISPECIES: glutamine amidotransferase [unclassified Corynebacterium]MBC3185535.1 glutamine amidotransferase [Corynebacterium sp. zg-331]MPV52029.1 glutamine amidotransferase [Corynebacterium sp. zg331]